MDNEARCDWAASPFRAAIIHADQHVNISRCIFDKHHFKLMPKILVPTIISLNIRQFCNDPIKRLLCPCLNLCRQQFPHSLFGQFSPLESKLLISSFDDAGNVNTWPGQNGMSQLGHPRPSRPPLDCQLSHRSAVEVQASARLIADRRPCPITSPPRPCARLIPCHGYSPFRNSLITPEKSMPPSPAFSIS